MSGVSSKKRREPSSGKEESSHEKKPTPRVAVEEEKISDPEKATREFAERVREEQERARQEEEELQSARRKVREKELLRSELERDLPKAAFSGGSQIGLEEVRPGAPQPPLCLAGPFQQVVIKCDGVVVERLSPSSAKLSVKEGAAPICMTAPLKATPDATSVVITTGVAVFAEATKQTRPAPNGVFWCGDAHFFLGPTKARMRYKHFKAETPRHGGGSIADTIMSIQRDVKWFCNGYSDRHVYLGWKRRDLNVRPKPLDGAAFDIVVSSTEEELEVQLPPPSVSCDGCH